MAAGGWYQWGMVISFPSWNDYAYIKHQYATVYLLWKYRREGFLACDSGSEWIGREICCRCINPYYGMCCVCRWGLLMHHLWHFALNCCFILFRVVTREGERGRRSPKSCTLICSASEVSVNLLFASLDCGCSHTMQIQWSGTALVQNRTRDTNPLF